VIWKGWCEVKLNLTTAFLLALVAEIGTSWWRWARAPTDGLRVYWEGNFWAYAAERLVPWLIILIVAWMLYLLVKRFLPKPTAIHQHRV
jgi:hypothetical protein